MKIRAVIIMIVLFLIGSIGVYGEDLSGSVPLTSLGGGEDGKMYMSGKLYTGKAYNVYEDGKKSAEFTYKDGEQEGLVRIYHGNGNVRTEYNIENGEVEGKFVSYYEDGEKAMEGYGKGGSWDGSLISYYPNGNKMIEKTYKDGGLNGPYYTYDIDGSVVAKGTYADNKVIGTHTEYYPSGKTRKETPYVDGEINGKVIEYYESGSIKEEWNYENGVQVGESTTYPDKIVEEESTSNEYDDLNVDGLGDSTTKITGVASKSNEGVDDSYEGYRSRRYHKLYNWKILVVIIILIRLLGSIFKKAKGQSRRKEDYRSYSNRMRKEEDNNYTRKESTPTKFRSYENSRSPILNGKWVDYYPSGEKKEEGNYVDGRKEGPWYSYYRSGKIAKKCKYSYGQLDGKYIRYTESGEVIEKRKYKAGRIAE